MLTPTKRKSILRSGELKSRVAEDPEKVRDNVTKTARQQGATQEEIDEILRELGL